MTATDVRIALRKRYGDHRKYAVAEEVGLTTGFSHRRLDMMVLNCFNSNGFRIDGIEIKVSTSDLRRELEDPEKHIAFFDVIDYYTLAVPVGVVDPLLEVIPKKWGILIVNEDGTTRYKKRPLALEDRTADGRVPRGFFASVVRAIQQRQPSAAELKAEYDRGYKEGEENRNQHIAYMSERVAKEVERLEAYDKLQSRLRLWGSPDKIEKALDEFEAFRKLDPTYMKETLKIAIEQLTGVQRLLDGKSGEMRGSIPCRRSGGKNNLV